MFGSRMMPVRIATVLVSGILITACSGTSNPTEVVESTHDAAAAIVTEELGVGETYREELDPPACGTNADDGFALRSQWDAPSGTFSETDVLDAFDAVELLLAEPVNREVDEGPPQAFLLRVGTPGNGPGMYSLDLVGLPDSVFLVTNTVCVPSA